MRRDWTLRQLLAVLRGVGLIVSVVLALTLAQLVPSLLRGGLRGVHEHIVAVAIVGVPPERWSVAVARMYEAMGTMAAFVCALYWGQRYVARRLAAQRR